jgi:uncharacterized protein YkwD
MYSHYLLVMMGLLEPILGQCAAESEESSETEEERSETQESPETPETSEPANKVEIEENPNPEPVDDKCKSATPNEGDKAECACIKCINDARKQSQDCGGTNFPPAQELRHHPKISEVAQEWSEKMQLAGQVRPPGFGKKLKDRGFDKSTGISTRNPLGGEKVCLSWLKLKLKNSCRMMMNPVYDHVGCRKVGNYWTAYFGRKTP